MQPSGTQSVQALQLVDAEFVAASLQIPGCKLLEAHFTSSDHPRKNERQGTIHLPGAIQVHPSYLESGTDRSKYYPFYKHPDDGNLLPDRELALALQAIGVTPETPVIVYGSEPDGTMAAARVVWALLYAGVKNVRLLDGGLDAWLAHGGSTCSHIRAAADFDVNVESISAWKFRPELLATTADVRKVSRATGFSCAKLVDVRRPGETNGSLTENYSFYSTAGHIPNAYLQGNWDNLLDMSTHKIGPTLDKTAQRWRDQGIIDSGVESGATELIFYCGTGWRSSVAFVVARLLGLRAKNYDNGFYGWSWSGENEIAVAIGNRSMRIG